MKFHFQRFNLYLLASALALPLALACGCKTAGQHRQDKVVSTFRLHLEENPGSGESTALIQLAGVELYVNNQPFLDERSVTNATVVDTRDGGYAMRVQFDKHGTLVLDSVTTALRGRRIAIFTQFGAGKPEHSRWLAAPYGAPITDGVLLFTPAATREESEEIVLGLNHAAKKAGNR
jgi:hypothetical protein